MRVSHPLMTIHEILFAEIIKCETQALIQIHFENYLLLEYWKSPRKDTVIEQCKISWSQVLWCGCSISLTAKHLWWSPILIQEHDFKFSDKGFIKDYFVKNSCSFFQPILLGNGHWTKKNAVCDKKEFLKIQYIEIMSDFTKTDWLVWILEYRLISSNYKIP